MTLYFQIFWTFLQKAWAYIQKYWQIIFAVVAAVVGYFLYRKGQVDFATQLQEIQHQHDDELQRIESARQEERKTHEADVKQLEATMVAVQKQYDTAKRILEDQKKAEIKEIVTQYSDDPVVLSQKLSEVTGFKIILPE
jgi:uncharacterized protein HemX